MTKTIEEELAGPFGALDKALERVARTYTKFIHGISPEQRAAVFAHLEQRLASTKGDMERAGQKATPFSFATAGESCAPRGQEREIPMSPLRDTRNPNVLRQQPGARPIGRLANDANEPGAGTIVVGQPIRSQVAPLQEEGVGFIAG